MSVSLHKGKDLRMHPNAPSKQQSWCHPHSHRSPVSREHLLRAPRSPRAAPPPPERGAVAAGPTPAAATQCGPEPPRRRSLCGRPVAHTKARPPGLTSRLRRAPTLSPGTRLPQRLGHRLPDVAAQQAEQERRRPAHLRAAGPRPARPRRPPGWSGASGAAGRRASLHVAWLRARRAHRPIGRAPARRGAGLRSPRPLPPPHTRVGSPKRRRRGPAHSLTPSRPSPPASCAQFPGPGATWRPPCRGAGCRRRPSPTCAARRRPLLPALATASRPQSRERDLCHPDVPRFPVA